MTRHEINTSHLGEKQIILKTALGWDIFYFPSGYFFQSIQFLNGLKCRELQWRVQKCQEFAFNISHIFHTILDPKISKHPKNMFVSSDQQNLFPAQTCLGACPHSKVSNVWKTAELLALGYIFLLRQLNSIPIYRTAHHLRARQATVIVAKPEIT